MFRFAMCWNRSAHVSFRNGLELLRPCFISQWAGIAPPMLHSFCLVIRGWDASWFNLSTRLGHQPMSFLDMFHLVMGWNCSAHVSLNSFHNGLELLRPCFISQSCWWLDSIYFIFSPVGARRFFLFICLNKGFFITTLLRIMSNYYPLILISSITSITSNC